MDPRTVVAILAIHLICSGGLFHLIGRRMPACSGLQHWAAGGVIFGVAYAGRVAWGLPPPQPVALVLDAMMVLGTLLYISGLREFVGRSSLRLRHLVGLVALYVAVQLPVAFLWGFQGRSVLLNVVLGSLYVVLAGAARVEMRRQTGQPRAPYALLATLMGSLGALTVARGISIGIEGTATMFTSLGAKIYYTYASLAALMVAMNLLWLVFVRLNGQLVELAVRDPLTRVFNRNGLDDVLARHFAARGAAPVTLLQVDVDHFKQINDGHGHAAGDAVLCAVAASLTTRVRGSDFVARVGGEEFLVVCAGGDAAMPMALAERLRAGVGALEVPVDDGRASVRCTVSVGVSRRFEALADWQRAWREADRALYAAKAAGRDRVVVFEPALSS